MKWKVHKTICYLLILISSVPSGYPCLEQDISCGLELERKGREETARRFSWQGCGQARTKQKTSYCAQHNVSVIILREDYGCCVKTEAVFLQGNFHYKRVAKSHFWHNLRKMFMYNFSTSWFSTSLSFTYYLLRADNPVNHWCLTDSRVLPPSRNVNRKQSKTTGLDYNLFLSCFKTSSRCKLLWGRPYLWLRSLSFITCRHTVPLCQRLYGTVEFKQNLRNHRSRSKNDFWESPSKGEWANWEHTAMVEKG